MYPSQLLSTVNDRRLQNGFTLIELVIVIAIIGLLAAIAYPQYGNYVKKSRRADGHLALLQEIQNLERCKSTNYTYTGCTLSSTTSPEGNYLLAFDGRDATSYTITATATGVQASDTDCAVMNINHQGVRGPSTAVDCWPD